MKFRWPIEFDNEIVASAWIDIILGSTFMLTGLGADFVIKLFNQAHPIAWGVNQFAFLAYGFLILMKGIHYRKYYGN